MNTVICVQKSRKKVFKEIVITAIIPPSPVFIGMTNQVLA